MATTLPPHVSNADLEQLHDHAMRSHFMGYQQKNFVPEYELYDYLISEQPVGADVDGEDQGDSSNSI